MYFILLAVFLVKHYSLQLLNCRRLKTVAEVLESKNTPSHDIIIKELMILREKYFGSSKTLIEEIKNIFISKPLEPVLVDFYKRESIKMDKRREGKEVEKQVIINKIIKQSEL